MRTGKCARPVRPLCRLTFPARRIRLLRLWFRPPRIPLATFWLAESARRQKVCKRNSRTSENLAVPIDESENLRVVSSNAAAPHALASPQVRGKIRQRDAEIESANLAIAEAPVVHSATERASEPPRKRQHAQPRPVGGLLDNPPSVTVESA